MSPEYMLTKGKYCNGLQCLRLMYKAVKMLEDIPDPDPATQFIFDQGHEVGTLAREQFPSGILIDMEPWEDVIKRTQEAIKSGAESIYEATFVHDAILVRVDILHRVGDNLFDIIEMKQSTKMKDEHIPDVAIQRYVIEGVGLRVNKTFLMHLNREYIHPDQGDLFIIEDCTESVLSYLPEIEANLEAQKDALECDNPPDIGIGPHCSKPRDCPLIAECSKDLPDLSIFNIPRFRDKWHLYNRGIVSLDELPSDCRLNAKQQQFIESYFTDEPIINKDAIKRELEALVEPIHFLDFETINWAVPRHDGMRPYQQLPFQWSLHILQGDEITHHEFLWDNDKDPRPALIDSLLDALSNKGSIIVYSSFEKSRLNELAMQFPEFENHIKSIIGRLWDQLEIFRNHYIDVRFKGSNSIKNVLPVLVPELDYGKLDVQGGGTATASFARMIKTKDDKEKEMLRNALLEYCKLDTFAMVEIHKRLLAVIDS